VIQDACERGIAEVDLLRGNEPYKRNLAPVTRDLLRLRAAHGAAGHLALAALIVRSRAGRWRVGSLRQRARGYFARTPVPLRRRRCRRSA
jgi:CelD/BcsL family acetyltransferase involved in cellulose biosynthesis